MNPLTNTKNITKLNEREIALGTKGSWHDQYKNSAWLFIGGLPYDLTEGDIISVFSQYGEIVNINLIRDRKTGKTKGFCFLCYENQKSTVLAVDNFNGIKVLGRIIRVDHVMDYKPPKERDDDDIITKMLHEEGCAPKIPNLNKSMEVDEKPQINELKKKKKDKKVKKSKKKRKESSSSSSSSSSEDETVKIKVEKPDPGYDKYDERSRNDKRGADFEENGNKQRRSQDNEVNISKRRNYERDRSIERNRNFRQEMVEPRNRSLDVESSRIQFEKRIRSEDTPRNIDQPDRKDHQDDRRNREIFERPSRGGRRSSIERQNWNSRERRTSRNRSKEKSPVFNRHQRERTQPYRGRSNERLRDRSNERLRDRSNERLRERSNERLRDRSNERLRERSNERLRDRSNERLRDRSNERIPKSRYSNMNQRDVRTQNPRDYSKDRNQTPRDSYNDRRRR